MIWWLYHEIAENPDLELVLQVKDIRRIKEAGKVGLLLALEGLEPLENAPHLLDVFYKLGLRLAGLTHSRRNWFADGSQWNVKTGGLTDAGRKIVTAMNDLGIVIDLAHLNQTGYWEVLELSQHPVVLSHSSPGKYFPDDPVNDTKPRYPFQDITNSRQRLDALARNRGVFGVIFYRQESLEAVLDDIEFLLDRIGPEYIGLGSDFFGLVDAPKDLRTIAHLPVLVDGMSHRGLSDAVIAGILGENYLRVFQEVWK
jgi:membrane dipeptidase